MTRHSVWNSLPKNVDFSTLTSFRHSIDKIFLKKSNKNFRDAGFLGDGRQQEAHKFFLCLSGSFDEDDGLYCDCDCDRVQLPS